MAQNIEDNCRFAYEILSKNRDLDTSLLLTRFSVLLVIQGILISFLGSSFSLLYQDFFYIIIIMSIFGLISSYIMYVILRGSDFWVTYWEEKCAEIEGRVFGDITIFRKHPTTSETARSKSKSKGYKSTRKSVLLFSKMFPAIWVLIILITTLYKFNIL